MEKQRQPKLVLTRGDYLFGILNSYYLKKAAIAFLICAFRSIVVAPS